MESERIFSETPKSAIWNRLDILTTFNGVKKELKTKDANGSVAEELLDDKAKGVAFCVRSARDLFSLSNIKNLTPSLICLYYGTYNLLSALLIGDVSNELTLEQVEKFSKYGGHGLKTINHEPQSDISNDELIYTCNNGFFPELLKCWGYEINSIATLKNYRKLKEIPDEEKYKLCSLKELLSRVPELLSIYSEVFKEQPNYINYWPHWNPIENSCKPEISLNDNTDFLKLEHIYAILEWPKNVKFDFDDKIKRFVCTQHFSTSVISSELKYHSPIAAPCTVKPLLGIDDTLLIYFQLLYMLSIWTRYKPNLWREICEGKYDHFRSVFSILADAAERVIPNLFINKFYQREFIFSPPAYYS